jgi:hypothetical protein
MPNHSVHHFPITTVFDNNFFTDYIGIEKSGFDEIFSEGSFGLNAWEGEDLPVFDFLSDKSGKITNPQQINIRRQEAEKFIQAVNEIDKDSTDYPFMLCSIHNDSIIFHGFDSKTELKEKIDKRFPNPAMHTIENPEQVLAVLEALNQSEMMMDSGGYAAGYFSSESPLRKLVEENPALTDAFENAAEFWGLNFFFSFAQDSKQLEHLSLPISVITRPEFYQARLAEMKATLQKMVADGWKSYPVKTVIDEDNYTFPYVYADAREIFSDLLNAKSFGDTHWSLSVPVYSDEPATLQFDITLDESGPITNPRKSAVRRAVFQELIESIEMGAAERDDYQSSLLCKWTNNDKNAVAFYTVKHPILTKNALSEKVAEQFPIPDKSIVTHPQEILNFLNAIDASIDHEDRNPYSILPDSLLFQLAKDSEAVDRFNTQIEAFDLYFYIHYDQEKISLPVIFELHPEIYQARIAQAKTELAEMVRLGKSMSMRQFPLTTVFDHDFYVDYSDYQIMEIFDEMFSEDTFGPHAWIEPISVPPYRLAFDLTRDITGKINDSEQITCRLREAEKFIQALNEIDKDNKDWPLAKCSIEGNSIVFHGFSSKKELQEKVDKRFPSAAKNTIAQPEKALKILKPFREVAKILDIDMDGYAVAYFDPREGFFFSKLIEENPDDAEYFENAAESWGLFFSFDFDEAGKLESLSLPLMAITRRNEFERRLNQMMDELAARPSHPVTTIFDDEFFADYDSLDEEFFDEILDEAFFGSEAWLPYEDGLAFDFLTDKSGRLTDPEHIKFRMNIAEKCVESINKMVDEDDEDKPFLRCFVDTEGLIVFKGIHSKEELKQKVDKEFPLFKAKDADKLIDLLKTIRDEMKLDETGCAMGYFNLDSQFAKLMQANPTLGDSFEEAARSWGLSFCFDQEQDEEGVIALGLPICSVTRPEVYQERLATMQRDLCRMAAREQQFPASPLPPIPTSTSIVDALFTLLQDINEVREIVEATQPPTATMRMLEFVRHMDEQRADNKKMHFFGTNDEALVESIEDFTVTLRRRV